MPASGDVICYPAGTRCLGQFSLAVRTMVYVVQWPPVPGETWPRAATLMHDVDGRLLALLG